MTTGETNASVRIKNDVLAELDEAAELIGVTRAEIIRRACAVYLWQTRLVREDRRTGRGGLWRRIFGPPVMQTTDETDELMAAAFRSLAARATRDGEASVA